MRITNAFVPRDRQDWHAWLQAHHASEQEVWLVYTRPSSGGVNIDYESSVEEALCFGWIDSVIQKIDEERYARKFTPRRPGSRWSATNQRRVARLIAEGRMTPAGMEKVTFDAAAVDLERPASRRPAVVMPARIEQALKTDPAVWQAFNRLAPSHRTAYLLWLIDAKRPETFERRLKKTVAELLAGRPTRMH